MTEEEVVIRSIRLDRKSADLLRELSEREGMSREEVVQKAVRIARELNLSPLKPEGKVKKMKFKLPVSLTEGIDNLSGTVRAGLQALYERRDEEKEVEGRGSERLMRALENLEKGVQLLKGLIANEIRIEVERSPEERAYYIGKLIQEIIRELEYFKEGPPEVREIFREVVPPEDVGYVTTLLRALFSEDQFQRWILMSDYRVRGARHGD